MVVLTRARSFKLLRRQGNDSEESIPPAYVAWRAGTIPYCHSVPSPHRLFKNSSTGDLYPPLWSVRQSIFQYHSSSPPSSIFSTLFSCPSFFQVECESIPKEFCSTKPIKILKVKCLWLSTISSRRRFKESKLIPICEAFDLKCCDVLWNNKKISF
jgi:hypothetical protein